MTQGEETESRQNADETIDQMPEAKQRDRHQHALLGFHRFIICKLGDGRNVRRRESILRRQRHPLADPFRELEHGLPQMREISDHDTCLARAKRMKLFKKLLAIVQRSDRVENKNIVEWTFHRRDRGGIFSVPNNKCQTRMPLAGDINQRGAKVDAHAMSRFERCERVADAASDFKNARILPESGTAGRLHPRDERMQLCSATQGARLHIPPNGQRSPACGENRKLSTFYRIKSKDDKACKRPVSGDLCADNQVFTSISVNAQFLPIGAAFAVCVGSQYFAISR